MYWVFGLRQLFGILKNATIQELEVFPTLNIQLNRLSVYLMFYFARSSAISFKVIVNVNLMSTTCLSEILFLKRSYIKRSVCNSHSICQFTSGL